MIKTITPFALAMLWTTLAFAQQRDVSGVVRDQATNEPIAGVNIVVKGSGTGTASDVSGRFNLSANESSNIIRFSFIGYRTKDVTIPVSNVMEVSLEQSLPG